MCASLGMGGCVDIVPEVPPERASATRFRCLDGVVEFDEESYGRYGGRERCRVHLSLLPTSTSMPSFRVGDGPLVVMFDTPSWKGWEFGGLFVTYIEMSMSCFKMTLEGFADGLRKVGNFPTMDEVDEVDEADEADEDDAPEEFEWLDD